MRKGEEVHLIEERGTVPGGGIDGPAEKGPQHGSDVSRRLLLANDRIFEVERLDTHPCREQTPTTCDRPLEPS